MKFKFLQRKLTSEPRCLCMRAHPRLIIDDLLHHEVHSIVPIADLIETAHTSPTASSDSSLVVLRCNNGFKQVLTDSSA